MDPGVESPGKDGLDPGKEPPGEEESDPGRDPPGEEGAEPGRVPPGEEEPGGGRGAHVVNEKHDMPMGHSPAPVGQGKSQETSASALLRPQ